MIAPLSKTLETIIQQCNRLHGHQMGTTCKVNRPKTFSYKHLAAKPWHPLPPDRCNKHVAQTSFCIVGVSCEVADHDGNDLLPQCPEKQLLDVPVCCLCAVCAVGTLHGSAGKPGPPQHKQPSSTTGASCLSLPACRRYCSPQDMGAAGLGACLQGRGGGGLV